VDFCPKPPWLGHFLENSWIHAFEVLNPLHCKILGTPMRYYMNIRLLPTEIVANSLLPDNLMFFFAYARVQRWLLKYEIRSLVFSE